MTHESFEEPTETIPCSDKFHGGRKPPYLSIHIFYSLARLLFWSGTKTEGLTVKGPLENRRFGLTVSGGHVLSTYSQKILHTGDTESLDRCGS